LRSELTEQNVKLRKCEYDILLRKSNESESIGELSEILAEEISYYENTYNFEISEQPFSINEESIEISKPLEMEEDLSLAQCESELKTLASEISELLL
jgi:hypothetical protein